jgi:hypothetical protein
MAKWIEKDREKGQEYQCRMNGKQGTNHTMESLKENKMNMYIVKLEKNQRERKSIQMK